MKLLVLTGASGAGKTTIATALKAQFSGIHCHFFDSIGAPSLGQMVSDYGSAEGWQKAMTIEWFARLKKESTHSPILFEGQMRIAFIQEAMSISGIMNAEIVLIDCTDEARHKRLVEGRNQEELSTTTMMNWAQYLREEAGRSKISILDTTGRSVSDCAMALVPRLMVDQKVIE